MKIKGFTLIELIVVMGILAILATIVVIAVNPARQFASSRNAKRNSDVRALQQAINQHAADNNGVLYVGITTTAQGIGTGAGKLDLTSILVPNYLSAIPADPSGGTAADTKYTVYRDSNNAVGVSASLGELGGAIIAGNSPSLALNFDGVNDCVPLAQGKALPATTEYTYEAWFKSTGANSGYEKLMGLAGNEWDIRFHDTILTYIRSHTYSRSSGGTPQATTMDMSGFNAGDGNWHHIAIVFNGTSGWIKGYFDGIERGTTGLSVGSTPATAGGLVFPNTYRWHIGCSGGGPIHAQIDAVRLSTVARYTAAFTPPTTFTNDSNTVGLWNFNEGQGNTIRDESVTGNNGTTVDTQTWVVR